MPSRPSPKQTHKHSILSVLIFLCATLTAAALQEAALLLLPPDSGWLLVLPPLAGGGTAIAFWAIHNFQCKNNCKLPETLETLTKRLEDNQRLSGHLKRKSSEAERLATSLQRQITIADAAETYEKDEARFLTAFHAAPDPLIVSNLHTGLIIDVNSKFLSLVGQNGKDYLSYPVDKAFIWNTDNDAKHFTDSLQKEGSVSNIHAEIQDQHGTTRSLLISAQIMEFDGERHAISVAKDITEYENLRSELARKTEILETVLEHIPYYVFWKDAELRYIGTNSKNHSDVPEKFSPAGLTDEELNLPSQEIIESQKEDSYVLNSGHPILHKERDFFFPNGKCIDGLISKVPLKSQDGTTLGILGIVADMSETREYERQFRMLLNGIADPAWLKDTEGRYRIANRALGELCGIPAEEINGKTDFDIFPFLTAQKHQKADESVILHNQLKRTDEFLELNATPYWFEIVRQPFIETTRKGKPEITGSMGIARDISLRKTAESEVLKLSRALDQCSTAVAITTSEGIIEYANQRYCDLTNSTRKQTLGSHMQSLAGTDNANELLRQIHEGQQWRGEIEGTDSSGNRFWLLGSLSPVSTNEGDVYHGIMVLEDITKRKEQEQYIKYIAMHDGLTKLPNRRLFMHRLKHALAMFHRDSYPFSILFIDLNDFKQINDTFGHESGDSALVTISERLTHAIREVDTVARLGGDEFVILLHGISDAPSIDAACERINRAIAAPTELMGGSVSIGASIGISVCPEHGTSADILLSKADNAMYMNKKKATPQ